MRNKLTATVMAMILAGMTVGVEAASLLTEKGYTLEKVLIFSRHNMRASLANNDKTALEYSNRVWDKQAVAPGHLTYKGGAQETLMGEYYRTYLEDEKFIPIDWHPAKDKVRFYANSYQRTIATARHFAAGLSPIADISIEYHKKIDEKDPVFLPSSKIDDPVLYKQAAEWTEVLENGKQDNSFYENREGIVREIERIVDFKNSKFAKKEGLKHFDESKFTIETKKNKIYKNAAYMKPYQLADSIIMRYYDNSNDKAVVWNISKPSKALAAAGKMLTMGGDVVWKNPYFAKHMTRNLLPEIVSEINSKHDFTFLCGHDTNLATLLTAIDVETYELPNTITTHTPIGGKIVIEKRKAQDGKEYASLEMVYASDKQLRNLEVLDLKNPPMKEPMIIKGLKRNVDGLYAWDEFVEHLEKSTYH